MDKAIESIFNVNLGVKPDETVLVFTDHPTEAECANEVDTDRRESTARVAKRIAKAGQGFGHTIFVEFPATGSHGTEPPEIIWEKTFGTSVVEKLKNAGAFDRILNKQSTPEDITLVEKTVAQFKNNAVNCIIALSNYSTSHTKFRDLACRVAGVRFASMPIFEEFMLTGVMTADWKALHERTVRLANTLQDAGLIHITTPIGTDISFSIKGRPVKPDTGIITEPGSFSNLPAGEAFAAPVEGTANGVMVLEWAPMRKLDSPVTITVKDGLAIEVSGDEEFVPELQKILTDNPLFGNIAELGIGTNDKATRPDNILESEKILGTIHIALGDNSTFGGTVSVPFHQDFIFFNPTLTAEKDGEQIEILKDGELLV